MIIKSNTLNNQLNYNPYNLINNKIENRQMGQCIGKQNTANKYIVASTPIKLKTNQQEIQPSEKHKVNQQSNIEQQGYEKQNDKNNLNLNLKQTIEIKRKPTGSQTQRNATVNMKSAVRSNRSNQNLGIDDRAVKLLEKDALMASIYLRVRQNFKKY